MSFLIAWIVVAVITAKQNFIDCNAIIYESIYVVLQPTGYSRDNLRRYVKICFMDSNLFGTRAYFTGEKKSAI